MLKNEVFDVALNNLHSRRTIALNGGDITIAFLLRSTDWRPLRADWWDGKEVSIIGADLSGNFFLRHCDGSVRYWDHAKQLESIVAVSVKSFVQQIR